MIGRMTDPGDLNRPGNGSSENEQQDNDQQKQTAADIHFALLRVALPTSGKSDDPPFEHPRAPWSVRQGTNRRNSGGSPMSQV